MIGACRSVSGPAADWRDGALWVSNGDESWCEPGSEPAGWTSGPDRDRTSSRRESSEDIGQRPSAQHRAGGTPVPSCVLTVKRVFHLRARGQAARPGQVVWPADLNSVRTTPRRPTSAQLVSRRSGREGLPARRCGWLVSCATGAATRRKRRSVPAPGAVVARRYKLGP